MHSSGVPLRPHGSVSSKLCVGIATLVAIGVLLCGFAASSQAATGFSHVGAFSVSNPDGALHHNQRIAVEHSTGRIFKTDVVGDQIVVYAPTATGADQLTAFGSGELADPHGIAVDQATGDVYVADAGNDRIIRYASNGLPTPTYARDLTYAGPAAGTDAGEVGSFRAAIAIDAATGKLYVADPGHNLVKRYATDGSYDGFSFDGSGSPATFAGLQDIAIDSTGDVIVVDSDGGDPASIDTVSRVERFSGSGVWEATIGPVPHAATVAVRPANDDVVVSANQDAVHRDQLPQLLVFDAAGTLTTALTVQESVRYSTFSGLAVDDTATGRLYAATDTSRGAYPLTYGRPSVQVYEPALLPTVTQDAPTGVEAFSASLHGTVNPEGGATSYHFEYSSNDGISWSATADRDAGDGTSEVVANETLGGLADGTTYRARLVAARGGATAYSNEQSFTTVDADPPTVTLAAPTNVGPTSADLEGTVDPHGHPTTYRFEYSADGGGNWFPVAGPDGDPGTDDSAGDGSGAVTVQTSATGLSPNSPYVVRLVATNGAGYVESSQESFMTAAAAPTVTTEPATAITFSKATLHGTVNANNTAGTYHFEYGTDTTYGSSTPARSIEGGFPTPVSAAISGLDARTTYHYRVVADNGVGSPSEGADQTFTTADPPPRVITGSATGITDDAAVLNATADPLDTPGTTRFYVTTDSSPDSRVIAAQDLPDTTGDIPLSAVVDGLAPGTTYRFRAAATSAAGTSFGDEQVFTTTGRPDPEVPILPIDSGASPFGCQSPRLAPHPRAVRAGRPVTLAGSDLGVGGAVSIGGEDADVLDWSSSAVTILMPGGISGGNAVVDCGNRSNAIVLRAVPPPSNRFTLGPRIFRGASGALHVRVPGAGQIAVRSGRTQTVTKTVRGRGTAKLRLTLTRAARSVLLERGSVSARVRIVFRPRGGSARAITTTLRFK